MEQESYGFVFLHKRAIIDLYFALLLPINEFRKTIILLFAMKCIDVAIVGVYIYY